MVRQNRIPRIPYRAKGLDQQGRHPEALYEVEDHYKPDPYWWVTEALIGAGLAAVVLFLLVILGLTP